MGEPPQDQPPPADGSDSYRTATADSPRASSPHEAPRQPKSHLHVLPSQNQWSTKSVEHGTAVITMASGTAERNKAQNIFSAAQV